MTERSSGRPGSLQVQYAFLEMPKLPARPPTSGAELWTWLFVHASSLREMPKDLPPDGPYPQAMALANQANFTAGELEAYCRVIDEIRQARD